MTVLKTAIFFSLFFSKAAFPYMLNEPNSKGAPPHGEMNCELLAGLFPGFGELHTANTKAAVDVFERFRIEQLKIFDATPDRVALDVKAVEVEKNPETAMEVAAEIRMIHRDWFKSVFSSAQTDVPASRPVYSLVMDGEGEINTFLTELEARVQAQSSKNDQSEPPAIDPMQRYVVRSMVAVPILLCFGIHPLSPFGLGLFTWFTISYFLSPFPITAAQELFSYSQDVIKALRDSLKSESKNKWLFSSRAFAFPVQELWFDFLFQKDAEGNPSLAVIVRQRILKTAEPVPSP